MTATLDANVLLYASDESSPRQEQARDLLARLSAGPELLYVFWPTVIAYLRIATQPSIFEAPLSLATAIGNVDQLLGSPAVQTTGEEPRFWQHFLGVAADADARGNLVPDAHLATLMRQSGVRTIWTHDRDFRRFPGLDVRDPFPSSS